MVSNYPSSSPFIQILAGFLGFETTTNMSFAETHDAGIRPISTPESSAHHLQHKFTCLLRDIIYKAMIFIYSQGEGYS
jgi:hypothetical protein